MWHSHPEAPSAAVEKRFKKEPRPARGAAAQERKARLPKGTGTGQPSRPRGPASPCQNSANPLEPHRLAPRPINEPRRLTMQTTSDEVLIGRIAGGDRLAMQVLFARHHVRVYRFVLRFVRNEATAEDLISEVFLDVWRQAGKFEGRSSVSTWMLSIARFKALS